MCTETVTAESVFLLAEDSDDNDEPLAKHWKTNGRQHTNITNKLKKEKVSSKQKQNMGFYIACSLHIFQPHLRYWEQHIMCGPV